MVGQSQSGYRQLDQCQVHGLFKKPFAPDLAAFECSSSKSRRVKGVKDKERMPSVAWNRQDRRQQGEGEGSMRQCELLHAPRGWLNMAVP